MGAGRGRVISRQGLDGHTPGALESRASIPAGSFQGCMVSGDHLAAIPPRTVHGRHGQMSRLLAAGGVYVGPLAQQ